MRNAIKLPAIGAIAASLAMFGGALTASAALVEPTLVPGNPSCEGGIKIDPVSSGTFGNLVIVVDGKTFSFSTNDGSTVSDVIVKGGPAGANWYHYDPPVTSDSGLQSPANKQGAPSGLSHLCFSVGDKTIPDPK